jgi:hypothetical protein
LAAKLIQFLLGEEGDLLNVEVFVERAGSAKGVFLFLEAMEATEAGQERVLGRYQLPEVREFLLQNLNNDVCKLLPDGDSKHWSQLLQKSHQFLLFLE